MKIETLPKRSDRGRTTGALVRGFLVQLGWEFYRLAARRRTWSVFGAVLVFESLVSMLMQVASVREMTAREIWKMRWHYDEAFSGLTIASHVIGEIAMGLGAFGIALVAADIMAAENEAGTLRTLLSRPVSRTTVFVQKLIACTGFVVVLTLFIGASALGMGLIFHGEGPLLIFAPHEEIIGTFDFAEGLERYGLAVLLLGFCSFSGMVSAFAFGCFNIRPATAAALALTVMIADSSIRVTPQFASVRPWCITTHLLAWRHAFNDTIPWKRIRGQCAELGWWDAAWTCAGFLAFRRRDIK